MAKTDKLSGTCQACFGSFALKGGRMVHHGYKRPGVGYLLGSCKGVGHEPYEVSCEITKVWLAEVQNKLLPFLRDKLAGLDTATEVKVLVKDWVRIHAEGLSSRYKDSELPRVMVTFTKGQEVTDRNAKSYAYSFESALKEEVRKVKADISDYTEVLKDLERRVREWVYSPEKLVLREEKVTFVHAQGRYSYEPSCRRVSFRHNSRAVTTKDESKVTCPRCLAHIEARKARASS
jgi:hypothetical protein